MGLAIYKPGQGYWTRVLTVVGLGILLLAGVGWIWNEMSFLTGEYRIYIQAGVAVAIMFIVSGVCMWVLNKPRTVDFMIATESEMKKVNWPTRREVVGSTIVVIGGMVLMAALLWIIDILFVALFIAIHVLEGESPLLTMWRSFTGH